MKRLNLIFDLDGTLFDTQEDIRSCMMKALLQNGFPTEEFSRRFRIGPPLEEAVRESLPEVQDGFIQKIVSSFREFYDSSEYPQTISYPGIEKMLQQLFVAGKHLFIATNKRRIPTFRLLEHFGWLPFFQEIVSFDLFSGRQLSKSEMLSYLMKKWNFSPDSAIMVGDTSGDIFAGKDVGFQTIAVTWGYGTAESIQEQGPTQKVSNSDELTQLLR